MAVAVSAQSAYSNGGNSTTCTATLTVTSGRLLVCMVCVQNGNFGTGFSSSAVTDPQGSWTLLKREAGATAREAVEVWCRDNSSFSGSLTVTATSQTTAKDVSMQVIECTGAAVTASQTGATATSYSTSESVSLTTTTAGAQVVGTIANANNNTALNALLANTSEYGHWAGFNGDMGAAFFSTSTVSSPGATTYGYTGVRTFALSIAVVEILPTSATPVSDTDTGFGIETQSSVVLSTDAGSAIDSSSLAAQGTAIEAGSLFDVSSLGVSGVDTGLGVETQSSTSSNTITDADVGSATDNSSLTVQITATEIGSFFDTVSIFASDSGSFTEGQSIRLTSTDSFVAAESSSVFDGSGTVSVSDGDSGSFADAHLMRISSTDSFVATDTESQSIVYAVVRPEAPESGLTVTSTSPVFSVVVQALTQGITTATIQLQVALDSAFTSSPQFIQFDTVSVSGRVATTVGGSALTDNTVYYWRVRYIDPSGVPGAWSAARSFNIATGAASTTIPGSWTLTSASPAPALWFTLSPRVQTTDTLTAYGQGFGSSSTPLPSVVLNDEACPVVSYSLVAATGNAYTSSRTINSLAGVVDVEHGEIVTGLPSSVLTNTLPSGPLKVAIPATVANPPTPALWYEAGDATTTTLTTEVESWPSVGGALGPALTYAEPPTLVSAAMNGHAALDTTHAQSQGLFGTISVDVSSGVTVLAYVYTETSSSSTEPIVRMDYEEGGSPDVNGSLWLSNYEISVIQNGSTTVEDDYVFTALTASTAASVSCTYYPAAVKVNGVSQTLTAGSFNTGTPGNIPHVMTRLVIGDGFIGRIFEVVVYNRVLTSTELATVDSYFNTKYVGPGTPPALPSSPSLHYQADDAVTTTRTAVTAWPSHGSAGPTLALSGNRYPTYVANALGGQPGVDFALVGTGSLGTNGTLPLATDTTTVCHAFIVVHKTAAPSGPPGYPNQLIFADNEDPAATVDQYMWNQIVDDPVSGLQVQQYGQDFQDIENYGLLPTGSDVIEFSFPPPVMVVNSTTEAGTPDAGNYGTDHGGLLTDFYIGGEWIGGGQICEVFIYDRLLSSSELTTIGTYFNAKYFGGATAAEASNSVWQEVVPTALDGTGWEIQVHAHDDYSTIVAIIPGYQALMVGPELNGTGAGSITLDMEDDLFKSPLAQGQPASYLLDYECVWSAYRDGILIFEWLGEVVDEHVLDDQSEGPRLVTISGKGIAEVLTWAVVLPEGYPNSIPVADPSDPNFINITPSNQFPIQPVMSVWTTVFYEATARGTINFVVPLFSSSKDSAGAPWLDTNYTGYSPIFVNRQPYPRDLGKNLLDMLDVLTGNDTSYPSTIIYEWFMRPQFKLDVRPTIGTHLENFVIFHQSGSAKSIERTRTRDSISNMVVVRDDIGEVSTAVDFASKAQWGQRELYSDQAPYQAQGESSVLRPQIAHVILEQNKLQKSTWTITSDSQAPGRVPFLDFGIGDWIGIEVVSSPSDVEAYRVLAITVQVDDAGLESVELTLESVLELRDRLLQRQLLALENTIVNNPWPPLSNPPPSDGGPFVPVYDPTTGTWVPTDVGSGGLGGGGFGGGGGLGDGSGGGGIQVFIQPTDPGSQANPGDFWYQIG